MIERRFSLLKIRAGDYLLPGNDETTLWRICRGEWHIGEHGEPLPGWELWQHKLPITHPACGIDDTASFEDWQYGAGFETRKDAIERALRKEAES